VQTGVVLRHPSGVAGPPMIRMFLALAPLLCVIASVHAKEVSRCTSESGAIEYRDTPCPVRAGSETISIPERSASDEINSLDARARLREELKAADDRARVREEAKRAAAAAAAMEEQRRLEMQAAQANQQSEQGPSYVYVPVGIPIRKPRPSPRPNPAAAGPTQPAAPVAAPNARGDKSYGR